MPSDPEEPSTVLHTRFDPSEAPDAAFVLTVRGGIDAGRSQTVDGSLPGAVLVGTSPACTLTLTDRSVSRRHISLEVEGRRLRLRDLDSTNGTFVNDVAIRDAWLRGGEVVRLGDTSLHVEQGAAKAIPLTEDVAFGSTVGGSREMRRLYPLCQRIATSAVSVVIEGETGTGKGVLAESLHANGPRASGPFVVFDCTAVSPSLVESELFGHERGAFTGAVAQRKGVFEQADGGTLFIDEIGDLDLSVQPKLLRALDRGEVHRVGGNRWIRVDVRVIAATRRSLDALVDAGRFRDDLFHRLAIARVELPPLRTRRGDVRLLVKRFCRELGAREEDIRPEVISRWERHDWPGNVRELRNEVARQLALGDLSAAEPEGSSSEGAAGDLIERVLAERLPLARARERIVQTFERRYVEAVLADHGGNVSRAAAASGLARRYFQMLKARMGL